MGQLRIDLALQMTGECADPHAAVVLLGPQAGRREITQRLPGPGAGFRQDQVRVAADLARRESGRHCAGVVSLAQALFGVRAQHGGEPRSCLGVRHR